MNILFLSYWGLNEGLTAATVLPHLKILSEIATIRKIVLVTIERGEIVYSGPLIGFPKVKHISLTSLRPLPNILNKIYDFIDFPKKLIKICQDEEIGKIISRGAPPGALAMKVSRKTGIPFFVESFEPHSAYMYETGTWRWYDPRYIFQKRWEVQIMNEAAALMPVTENFKNVLVAKGVMPEKIDVIPCCVPLDFFKFNKENRKRVRTDLGCLHSVVGVYSGKFGGIYYREEAFEIFRKAFDYFGGNFFLIIISPDDKGWILENAKKNNLPPGKLFVDKLAHSRVPEYLSASDFAFSLQSPKKSNLFLSPIKNGEYWANGLPILMTAGVGDDNKIIKEENGGAVFRDASDYNDIKAGLIKIEGLLHENGIRDRLHHIAARYRNFEITKGVYKKWYDKLT